MIYTIKISLPNFGDADNWESVFEIAGENTLEDLHLLIQDLVEFDNDHMYEFFIASTPSSRDRLSFNFDNEGIFDSNIENFITQSQGKKMFYLFDYGDCWYFQVSKTRKKPFEAVKGTEYPNIVSQSQFKPEQYPDWDEEDDDDF
jgi:hypothetical protein